MKTNSAVRQADTKQKLKAQERPKAKPPTKNESPPETKPPATPSWVGRVPLVKPGVYADGLPFHEVTYLSFKMMLRPNHFTSRESLFSFGDVLKGPAKKCGVGFSTKGFHASPLKIREVLFVDTADFRLYNNAFILRRRIPYKDGFPIGDPEIVFKFRHPDIQTAAETDVRPQIRGDHRVKFKCQALPRKDRLGGIRILYSHNVQFPRSALGLGQENVRDMGSVVKVFPVLARVLKNPDEKIEFVA